MEAVDDVVDCVVVRDQETVDIVLDEVDVVVVVDVVVFTANRILSKIAPVAGQPVEACK